MFQRLFGKKEEAQAYGSGEGKKIGLVNVDLRDGQQSLWQQEYGRRKLSRSLERWIR